MRTIAIGLLGILLAHGSAAAQTAQEQAQIIRTFQDAVTAYAEQHQGGLFCDALRAAAPPPVFTLPVAVVFRQIIAATLVEHAPATVMGNAKAVLPLEHPVALAPFPGTELHEFPALLVTALPALPAPLEYRLIGNDLVLRDRSSDVIVAVLPHAVGQIVTIKR
jgi:hypothetical protein